MERGTHVLKGYTLIEMMVVIVIMSITSSVLLVNFSGGRVTEELESSGREVIAVFRETQTSALSGYQAVANSRPCRFQISWSGTVYTVTYWYKDGAGACTQSSVLSSRTLSNGVSFSTANSFSFDLPRARVSFAGASNSMGTILTKGGVTHVVCTYTSGLIYNYAGSSCP